jgi:hypothetical protein
LADEWVVSYNGLAGATPVAFGDAQNRIVVNQPLFEQFLTIAESNDAHDE